jgi:hypothetical protein
MFQDGEPVGHVHVPVPPAVLEKARAPLCAIAAATAAGTDGTAFDPTPGFGPEADDTAAAGA